MKILSTPRFYLRFTQIIHSMRFSFMQIESNIIYANRESINVKKENIKEKSRYKVMKVFISHISSNNLYI